MVRGKVYFTAFTKKFGRELFVSNGTPQGTTLAVDLVSRKRQFQLPHADSWPVRQVALLRGEVQEQGWHGAICVRRDSFGNQTPQGTWHVYMGIHAPGLLRPQWQGSSSSLPPPVPATSSSRPMETTNGTVLLKDIAPGTAHSFPQPVAQFSGRFYFSAQDKNGRELWVTDGTSNGTTLLKDINAGAGHSNPELLVQRRQELLLRGR